jgi:uncharacterized repeat protein (TIGR01451 family)
VTLVTDAYPGGIVQADFNRDGKPDLAVSNSGSNSVNVFLGGHSSGLNIQLTHVGNFTVGQTGTYQITVQNPAFAATTGTVSVAGTLPARLTPTAISGTGWTCTLATLLCSRSDSLNNNQSFPVITLTVNVSGSLNAFDRLESCLGWNCR